MWSWLFALWIIWFLGGMALLLGGMGTNERQTNMRIVNVGGWLMLSAAGSFAVFAMGTLVVVLVTQQLLDK